MLTQPQLGTLLRDQRLRIGQTLRHAARNSSIAHSHLEKIETGSVEPTVATLLRILDAIQTPSEMSDKIFDVVECSRLAGDKMAMTIFERVLTESGVKFRRPTERNPAADFMIDIGRGREIAIQVKFSEAKERPQKKDT
jgi:transcriptional regulator with XRE-family HTH domain